MRGENCIVISRARHLTSLAGQTLTRGESLHGQISIIISFLTRQEFIGVLIGLVTNGGGARLPFLASVV